MFESNFKIPGKLVALSISAEDAALDHMIYLLQPFLQFPELLSPSRSSPGGMGEGVYSELIGKLERFAAATALTPRLIPPEETPTLSIDLPAAVDAFHQEFIERTQEREFSIEQVQKAEQLLLYVTRLKGPEITFQKLFSCKYLKIRLGRMPLDSQQKLLCFESHLFFFFPFGQDRNYVWGMYVTTNELRDEVDDIFRALFFERVRIPEDATGTPSEAIAFYTENAQLAAAESKAAQEHYEAFVTKLTERFFALYSSVLQAACRERANQYISHVEGRFYMTCFVAPDALSRLKKAISSVQSVRLEPLSA